MTEDFDIEKFDYTKNIVIEASAGTGKTHTITQIVPLLLTKGYKLSEILIVTFTTKAAGELRSRIREELTKLAYPATIEEKEKADKISENIRKNIENELEQIDDAPIFTIHSFCQKTLTENAVYSNCSQNMTLVDEDTELELFVGKYVRDNVARNKVLWYLYTKFQGAGKKQIQSVIKQAIKKYYLNSEGNENPDVVSLDVLSAQEEKEYKGCVALITNPNTNFDDANTNLDSNFMMRCFVIKNLKPIYIAWQQEKKNKGLQTYKDMIKIVHDAVTEQNSKLLQVLKQKYKYAIIDEFQDTNQLEWNIFKQIFTTDDTHHIAIVGDPKQSIYSFQDADSQVYNVAKEYIKATGGIEQKLATNYRSSKPMIQAINVLAGTPEICDCSQFGGYQDVQVPANEKIKPAQLNGKDEVPVHILYEPAEDDIVSIIKDYCDNKLQIWDKKINAYRDVNYGDFAVLVRKRKEANKLITKMTEAAIPFMWHKDPTVFRTKEAADWMALLSAIVATDFSAQNRGILHRALSTGFFTIDINDINDDKYDDLLCPERQLLLKWHNLAETRQYSKMIDSILADSGLSKRLASYDKIQSLSKYTQIGNFVLDYLVSKNGSVATVIKALKQREAKQSEEDEISVEKATDSPTVKFSTIHSAKGLEYPIVFYWVKKKPKRETNFVRINHFGDETTLEIESALDEDPDWQSLRYVAITRVSSLLFLVNVFVRFDKKTSKNKYVIDENIINQYPTLFAPYKPDNNSTEQNSDDSEDLVDNVPEPEKPGRIALSNKRLYKHSYTSLSHHSDKSDEEVNNLVTEESQRIDKEEAPGSDLCLIKNYDSDSGIADIGCDIYDVHNLAKVITNVGGAQYGSAVHEVFEHIDFTNYDENLEKTIKRCCKRHSVDWSLDNDTITDLIKNTMTAKFPEIRGNHVTKNSFCLTSLTAQDKKSEIEFNLNPDIQKPLLNYCNGFMDLVFVRNQDGEKVYSILDWKTDLLKDENNEVKDESYANYDCLRSHTSNEYAIQRVLYSYCLVQWLRQFYPDKKPSDIFNDNFGGIYYVYVRGCKEGTGNGIYAHTWKNYDALAQAFHNIITKGIYNG